MPYQNLSPANICDLVTLDLLERIKTADPQVIDHLLDDLYEVYDQALYAPVVREIHFNKTFILQLFRSSTELEMRIFASIIAMLLKNSAKFKDAIITFQQFTVVENVSRVNITDFIVDLAAILPPGTITALNMRYLTFDIKWFVNPLLLNKQLAYLFGLRNAVRAANIAAPYSDFFNTVLIDNEENSSNIISNSKDLMTKFILLSQAQDSETGGPIKFCHLGVSLIAYIMSFLGTKVTVGTERDYPERLLLQIQAEMIEKHLLQLPRRTELLPIPAVNPGWPRSITNIVAPQYLTNIVKNNYVTIKHDLRLKQLIIAYEAKLRAMAAKDILCYALLFAIAHHSAELRLISCSMLSGIITVILAVEFGQKCGRSPFHYPLEHMLLILYQMFLLTNSLVSIANNFNVSGHLATGISIGAITLLFVPKMLTLANHLMLILCNLSGTPDAKQHEGFIQKQLKS